MPAKSEASLALSGVGSSCRLADSAVLCVFDCRGIFVASWKKEMGFAFGLWGNDGGGYRSTGKTGFRTDLSFS